VQGATQAGAAPNLVRVIRSVRGGPEARRVVRRLDDRLRPLMLRLGMVLPLPVHDALTAAISTFVEWSQAPTGPNANLAQRMIAFPI